MNRISIEKRSAHADKASLNRSRRYPQSATSIVLPLPLPVKKDRPEDNMKTLKTQNLDSCTLQNRYECLHKLYKNLLMKMNQQNQNIEEQTLQLQTLNKIHETNEKEIQNLRGRLGFLQKNDRSTQTYTYQQEKNPQLTPDKNTRSCINIWKTSKDASKTSSNIMSSVNITQNEPQTMIKSPSNSKSLNKSNKNGMKISRNNKYFLDENTSAQRKERNLSPDTREKYRFMPTLRLY